MKLFKVSLIVLLLLFSYSTFLVPMTNAVTSSKESIQIFPDENGIRIVVRDIEFYFNATNGGEITEYFDLTVDPKRNLANMNLIQSPLRPLCSLTSSIFFLNRQNCYGTGFDTNAAVRVAGNSTDYVILQTSSKLMNQEAQIAKDLGGHVIHINSTWLFFSDGHIFLERILCAPNGVNVPPGWSWYPLYMTRTLGFNSTATFYMFNTTDVFTTTIDWGVIGNYSDLPVYPNDMNSIFGIAAPFSNVSLGGDGGHNILLIYKYNGLDISEWKSDNYNGDVWQTGFGAKHIFDKNTRIPVHKFYASIHFTHQVVSEHDAVEYAKEYKNATAFPLFTCNITTNEPVFHRGDLIQVFVSGKSYYTLNLLKARLIAKDNYGELFLLRNYGPFTASEDFSFTNHLLMNETVSQNAKYGNYTLTFQILSSLAVVIAQNSTTITLTDSG